MKMKLSILLLLSLSNNILLGLESGEVAKLTARFEEKRSELEEYQGSTPKKSNLSKKRGTFDTQKRVVSDELEVLRQQLEAAKRAVIQKNVNKSRQEIAAARLATAGASAQVDDTPAVVTRRVLVAEPQETLLQREDRKTRAREKADEDFDGFLKRTQSESQSELQSELQSEPKNDKLARGVRDASAGQKSKLSPLAAKGQALTAKARTTQEDIAVIKQGQAKIQSEKQLSPDEQAFSDLAMSPDEQAFSNLARAKVIKKVMPNITSSEADNLSENPAELRKFKDLLNKHFNPGVVSNLKTYWSDVKTWLESSNAKIKQGIQKLIKEANTFYESKIRNKYFNRVVAPNAQVSNIVSIKIKAKDGDNDNDEVEVDTFPARAKEVDQTNFKAQQLAMQQGKAKVRPPLSQVERQYLSAVEIPKLIAPQTSPKRVRQIDIFSEDFLAAPKTPAVSPVVVGANVKAAQAAKGIQSFQRLGQRVIAAKKAPLPPVRQRQGGK